MVGTTLVESDIEEGRRLIATLNKKNRSFRIKGAFWIFQAESREWRLMIVTPMVDQRGPFKTYYDVHEVLKGMEPKVSLSPLDISVISPNDKLAKGMKRAVRVPQGFTGVRCGLTRVEDTLVDDAYVYSVVNKAA